MNFNPHCMWENFNTQTHPSLQTVDGWFCQNRFLLLLHILFKFLAWKYIDRSHLWSFLSWIFNSGWRTSQRDEINALPFKNKNEDFFFSIAKCTGQYRRIGISWEKNHLSEACIWDRQQGYSFTGAFISTAYTVKLSLRQLRLAEENSLKIYKVL